MQRRRFVTATTLAGLGLHRPVSAAVDNDQAAAGVRSALERGANAAVALLGRTDGFLGNPKVRIGLQAGLDSVARMLRMAGQGRQIDELVTAMNRAAEAAVPQARTLLVSTIKAISVEDAWQIVRGSDTAVTEFFAAKTRQPLTAQFLPIVTRATERVSLAAKYNALAGKAAAFGLVQGDEANLQNHVTAKALDGLYLMIGEEERKIRADPAGTGSALLKKVFGSLR